MKKIMLTVVAAVFTIGLISFEKNLEAQSWGARGSQNQSGRITQTPVNIQNAARQPAATQGRAQNIQTQLSFSPSLDANCLPHVNCQQVTDLYLSARNNYHARKDICNAWKTADQRRHNESSADITHLEEECQDTNGVPILGEVLDHAYGDVGDSLALERFERNMYWLEEEMCTVCNYSNEWRLDVNGLSAVDARARHCAL